MKVKRQALEPIGVHGTLKLEATELPNTAESSEDQSQRRSDYSRTWNALTLKANPSMARSWFAAPFGGNDQSSRNYSSWDQWRSGSSGW